VPPRHRLAQDRRESAHALLPPPADRRGATSPRLFEIYHLRINEAGVGEERCMQSARHSSCVSSIRSSSPAAGVEHQDVRVNPQSRVAAAPSADRQLDVFRGAARFGVGALHGASAGDCRHVGSYPSGRRRRLNTLDMPRGKVPKLVDDMHRSARRRRSARTPKCGERRCASACRVVSSTASRCMLTVIRPPDYRR